MIVIVQSATELPCFDHPTHPVSLVASGKRFNLLRQYRANIASKECIPSQRHHVIQEVRDSQNAYKHQHGVHIFHFVRHIMHNVCSTIEEALQQVTVPFLTYLGHHFKWRQKILPSSRDKRPTVSFKKAAEHWVLIRQAHDFSQKTSKISEKRLNRSNI